MKIEYFNLYTHFILTTLFRKRIIPEKNRERIEKYITGIVKNYESKLYAVYANPEHVHMVVSRSPKISEDYLIDVVAESTKNFINNNNLAIEYFDWQETASAFSIAKKDVDAVCKYVLNQKEHHKTTTFEEEYRKFIKFYEKTIKPKK